MLPTARLFDLSTGHGSCPPRPNSSASSNVFVNGRPVHRMLDSWVVHCTHGGTTLGGNSTILVNGRIKARVTSPIDCGEVIATGSANVLI